MKNEKIYAIFALTIILLSGLGFAYAHWEDYVELKVTAYTGVLEMVLLDPYQTIFVWYDGDWVPQDDLPDMGLADKVVMECDWDELSIDDAVNPKTDQELQFEHPCPDAPYGWKNIHFYWDHVYPETAIRYEFAVHNIGTIAAHWIGAEITEIMVDLPGDDLGPIDVTDDPSQYGIDIVVKAWWDDRVWTIEDLECCEPQIHPCEEVIMWIEIYANDDLVECSDWTWELRLDFAQYNYMVVQSYDQMPPVTSTCPPGGPI